MTNPPLPPPVELEGMVFQGTARSEAAVVPSVTDETAPLPDNPNPYPKALLGIGKEGFKDDATFQSFSTWVDQWLTEVISSQQDLIQKWATEEKGYRALTTQVNGYQGPFEGSCMDVIPAIAMAVDPIQARLSQSIFKADPVVRLKPLRKKWVDKSDSLEKWINYYQRHKLHLREVFGPRLFEFCKHGTMVFKTIYDRETYSIKTYDREWKVVQKEATRFQGPRVIGIPINYFFAPPMYQDLQKAPFVAERQVVTYGDLMIAQQSKKIEGCEWFQGKESLMRDELELQQQLDASQQETTQQRKFYFEFWEIWCKYDINGDGIPENLVLTYSRDYKKFVQIRYNWYFSQRYPYTVIPYTVANQTIQGLGLCEMIKPFQDQLTNWHRIATDNAYLANIRMFIARTDAKIENRPKMFSGRVFRVDEPTKDLIPFAAADIYNSTLSERQNTFGLIEKRTGVSDYLTGRESPILGSRATATSTMALIQEGKSRVEEVLENVRTGVAEIVENMMAIWVQYGLDGAEDIAFGDDQVARDVREFFDSVGIENVHGAMGIDLSASDASNSRVAQQQMQLSIIQVLMGYYEKLVSVGQMAIQAQQQMPQLAEMLEEIMTAARKMFLDLLQKYDIRNPDAYLPDLEKIFNAAANGQAGPGELEGLVGTITGQPGVQAPGSRGPAVPVPSQPGSYSGGANTAAPPLAG